MKSKNGENYQARTAWQGLCQRRLPASHQQKQITNAASPPVPVFFCPSVS